MNYNAQNRIITYNYMEIQIKEQINGEGTALHYKRILSNKCRRNERNKKSSSKHPGSHCSRQDPLFRINDVDDSLKINVHITYLQHSALSRGKHHHCDVHATNTHHQSTMREYQTHQQIRLSTKSCSPKVSKEKWRNGQDVED